jgi:hypothetical protein
MRPIALVGDGLRIPDLGVRLRVQVQEDGAHRSALCGCRLAGWRPSSNGRSCSAHLGMVSGGRSASDGGIAAGQHEQHRDEHGPEGLIQRQGGGEADKIADHAEGG